MIGARFNGPVDLINYHAQNLSINRGAWKTMENEWDRQLDPNKTNISGNPGVAGAVTDIVIIANFDPGVKRPSWFEVQYEYGGVPQRVPAIPPPTVNTLPIPTNVVRSPTFIIPNP